MSELFGDQTETTEQTTTTDENQDTSLFTVGERKYDVESARKKIENADTHISKLEQENEEMRQKLEKAKTYEDLLESLTTKSDTTGQTKPVAEDDVQKMVQEALEERERTRTAEANLLAADKALKEVYGDKAKEVMIAKGEELGLGPKTLKDIASNSPSAFLKLFDQGQAKPMSTNTPHSSVNSESVNANQSGPKQYTYAYYQEMRKSDPTKYNSVAIQQEILRKADELGREQFFS